MRTMTRLNRAERLQRLRCPKREPDVWIYTIGGADSGQDDTMARCARTGELRAVVDLPQDCTKIVITYDRE